MALAAALIWLRDPPWLIDETTGLRGWEAPRGEPRFRWSSGHASFFVPASAGEVAIPVSTTFADAADQPMMVTVSVDDAIAARVILADPGWRTVRVPLPPPGRRRVRRIDVRTNITREGNRGVRIGEVELARKVAARLLPSDIGGTAQD